MASEGEDKPQCITNVNIDQERNFINIYKNLEHTLNNKHETFTNKVESLIEVWKQVCLYSLSDEIPYVVQLMDWAKLHTLNIVLTGEWKIHKDVYEAKLLHEVERTESVLHNLNNMFSLRCKKLAEVIRDPWGNPILNRLLNSTEPNIGPEEIEFFSMETGYFVSMRLKKLCESQCEDLALNLVAAFMRCYRMAETQQFNLNTTEKQRWFIFDVYVALLFKYKKMPLILSTLKSLDLKEGLDLVKRFSNKRVKISKVWRHCTRIAQLATQVYVTAAIMKPISESGGILSELLDIWFVQCESDSSPEDLMVSIRRIIQAADSAVHLYIFCEAVYKKFGSKVKTFTIELFIRALTTDMNDLERQKNENDVDKVAETTKRLADGFCRLADVLDEHVSVSRECILTSFSLQPTSERLRKIEELASRCGFEVLDTGQEWKCKLHPPVLPSDELCWICNSCGEYMSQPQLEIPINTNTALSEALTVEQLGLSPQLCDDLAVVLSSPRYQVLSWLHQWDNLYRLCVMYLNDPERTKNLVTELKFVDIDYSVFMTMKREPLDENELTGIERGYEQFLENDFFGEDGLSPLSEDSESQDSRPYSLGSDGAGDSLNYYLPITSAKSDPNVLKSLRMFRPSLKRARIAQIGETIPQKLFIGNQGVGTTSAIATANQIPSASNTCTLPHTATSLAPSIGGPVHNNMTNSTYFPPINSRDVLRNYLAGNFSYRTEEFLRNLNRYGAVNPNRFAQNYHSPNHQSTSIVNTTNDVIEPRSGFRTKEEILESIRSSEQFLEQLRKDNPTNYYDKVHEIMQEFDVDAPPKKTTLTGMSLLYRNSLLEAKERRKNKQKCASFQKYNHKSKTVLDRIKRENKQAESTITPCTKELQLAYLEKKRNSLIDSLFRNVEKKKEVRNLNTDTSQHHSTAERDKITITSLLSSNKDLQVSTVDSKTPTASCYSPTNFSLNSRSDYYSTSRFSAYNYNNAVTKSQNRKAYSSNPSANKESLLVKSLTSNTSKSFMTDKYKTYSNPLPAYNSNTKSEPDKPQKDDSDLQHSTNFNDMFERLLKSKIEEMSLDIKNTSEFLKENVNLNKGHVKSETSHLQFRPSNQLTINAVDYKIEQDTKVADKLIIQPIELDTKHLDNGVKTLFSVCNPRDDKIVNSQSTLSIQRIEHKNSILNYPSASFLDQAQNSGQQTSENVDKNQHKLLETFRPHQSQLRKRLESSIKEKFLKCKKLKSLMHHKSDDVPISGKEKHSMKTDFEATKLVSKKRTYLSSSSDKQGLDGCNITEKNASSAQEIGKLLQQNLNNKMNFDSNFYKLNTTDGKDVGVISTLVKKRKVNEGEKNATEALEQDIHSSNREKCNSSMGAFSDGADVHIVRKRGRPRKKVTKDTLATKLNVTGKIEETTTKRSAETNESTGDGVKQFVKCKKCVINIGVKEVLKSKKLGRPRKHFRVEDTTSKEKEKLFTDSNVQPLQHTNNDNHVESANTKSTDESTEAVHLKEAKVILERIDMNNYSPEKQNIEKKSDNSELMKKEPKSDDMIPRVILNRDDIKVKTNVKVDTNLISKLDLKNTSVVISKVNDVNINNVPEKQSVQSGKVLNPCVILKRIDVDKKRDVKSVLANVPGLNDLELIRPSPVNHIVQVVQVAGGRPTTNNGTSQNTQTSTQVTPHIQRIGQPRVDKSEQTTNAESSTSTTNSVTSATTSIKPPTTQPSTLINILSQQIIRPSQSNNNCIRSRSSPLINILSQQIIRPPTSVLQIPKSNSETTSSDLQGINTSRVVTTDQQIVGQLSAPVRNSTAIKTVVGSPSTDQNRIVQFICKSSDGKLIPVTSFTSNRVVKVSTTQTVTSTSPDNSTVYEENFTKFVQVTPKAKDLTENAETLPKFQQAFGKSVYNNVDSTDSGTSVNSESIINNTELDKKAPPKNSTSVNIQPIQGGVIYTRQMPVGQTINLIPPGRGQVFRIASSNTEQISLVKDTVIHSKMSALLAAALQGKQKNSEGNEAEVNASSDETTAQATRVTVTRPTLVQNARIVKPVIHIPSNVIRNSPQPNLSSTTLEQLREFDMVYKQVKERSSTTVPSVESPTTAPETTESSQRISVTYLNQGQKFTQLSPVVVVSSYCNLQPAASPSLSVTSQGSSSPCVTPAPTPTLPKTSSKSSKGKSVKSTTTHTSKASPIPKPQQKPQEDEHTTQRIFDILAEYAEQLRNSPDLNNKPAPRRRSNPPTNPSQNSKRKKNSGSKKTGGQCSSTLTSEADLDDPRTVGSEDSSCGVVQISMQEDEQPSMTSTTSESNDVPVTSRQQLILTDASHNQARNLIIADSSVGEALKMPNTAVLVPGNYIMPVSMVKGGQQIAVVSGGSKILATVPAHSGPNMLLFQSFLNQTRKSGIPTVKYSTIQPISGISSQSLAGVSAQPPVILPPTSHGLTAVTLGQPIALKKLDESENRDLLLTISQSQENSCSTSAETIPQPDSSTSSNVENSVKTEECPIKSENAPEEVFSYKKTLISGSIATPVIAQAACVKEESTNDHATGAQTIMTLNLNSQEPIKADEPVKVEERAQSVLVTACTSNGPMLSHSPPQYRKPSETACSCTDSSTKEYLRNGGKQNNEQKHFQGNTVYYQNKTKKVQSGAQRLDRELHQLCLQRKQAALERELRLQKSLSEECEDLGVDEPSTSDLFPEADLLFDSNHSPSFDQSSQDLIKRTANTQDTKEETKPSMTLFSDDDNSSSLRTDFLFEPVEYQPTATELEYDRTHQLTNGQGTTSNESGSSGEDNTLLQNCASMSDVTLNSPISPDPYADNTPPSLNKYKYKYSNRKKNDRHKHAETWPAEVSSSEDTTGSTELGKSSSHSPELCTNKHTHSLSCDDELSDSSFKVVRVAISKTDFLKEDESCEELHCEEDADCSLSGRGARRSVKKLCSCCNGSQDAAASRKRPASGPHHAPAPHKKAFLTKKR